MEKFALGIENCGFTIEILHLSGVPVTLKNNKEIVRKIQGVRKFSFSHPLVEKKQLKLSEQNAAIKMTLCGVIL